MSHSPFNRLWQARWTAASDDDTGRLHVHARPGQVQLARDEGREDVSIACRVARASTGRGENGNRSLDALADVPGVLERFPGTLEKEAMLGIDRAGGGHVHPEERGVETSDVIESAAGVDVRGTWHAPDSFTRVERLPLAQDRDGLAASPKVGPEFAGTSRRRGTGPTIRLWQPP